MPYQSLLKVFLADRVAREWQSSASARTEDCPVQGPRDKEDAVQVASTNGARLNGDQPTGIVPAD